ncbi:RNA polymerase sigma factor [Actinokineospora auranticolor]|uniref:RNA polymerase sigma-70 factor (ECF subfamily) n=1 Tax=Actinokineospora auranticolor TaxID=155976 RepID=A0A2S6GJP0_9PSEU|nr:RNA polymerase sigma factor [Actinokineospora auranticolor]PPK65410.1 RNA polymerase sigma-70 factor (ECF subfamily) [Actinokineospora auranticolor]
MSGNGFHAGVDEFDAAFLTVMERLRRRMALVLDNRHMAEDVVQDVYVRLKSTRRGRRSFTAHPSPYAHALAIAVRVARARWVEVGPVVPLRDLPTADRRRESVEAWQEVTRLLGSLTAREAAVVLLVDVDGRSLREAASLLGVHKATAQHNRRRALDKLRVGLRSALGHPC